MTPQAIFQIAIAVLQLAFLLGVQFAQSKQTKKDVNGIGAKQRASDERSERRHKQTLAVMIENSRDLNEAKRVGKLLREDSWPER